MKILLKALGVITIITAVALGASIIGSRNGVDIYSGNKSPAVEAIATASEDKNSAAAETVKSDSITNPLDNTSKQSDETTETNEYANQNENTVPTDESTEKDISTINNIDELVAMINKSSEKLEKEFTARINPSINMDTLLDDIPEDEIRYLTTISYSAKIIGDEITSKFTLEYKDHFSVLAAHKNESLLPLLTGNEKALLTKSKEILTEIIKDDMTDYEKEKAIHDYLVANYQYDNQVNTGNFTNLSYSGYGLLFNGIGVCDAYARIMYIFANMANVECLYVIGYAGGVTENYGHAWNKVKIDGEWYNVDVTWDDPLPDEKGRILYNYFNVTDEFLSADHTWNKDYYPAANTERNAE